MEENREALLTLGPGRHFGEWWGQKIQRGYGLKGKRFSLFNTSRWGMDTETLPACCGVVPVLYHGQFFMEQVDAALLKLQVDGSVAAPGWMQPEGIVVYHVAGNHMYKKTLDKDEAPKGMNGTR